MKTKSNTGLNADSMSGIKSVADIGYTQAHLKALREHLAGSNASPRSCGSSVATLPVAMPSTQSTTEPDADSFRVGDVWESPRGGLYKCVEVSFQGAGDGVSSPRRGVKKAVLRAGTDGSGRRVVRDWDAIGTMNGGQFWIRQSWGGQQ